MISKCLVAAWILPFMIAFDVPVARISGYKAALTETPTGRAVPVRFRDLWDRPKAYEGRRVQVEGRLMRQFSGPSAGELPERVESWIATESGDLICLVSLASSQRENPGPHSTPLQFDGTFLGLIDYESGDVTRRAPLVVGPTQPRRVSRGQIVTQRTSLADWLLAAACLIFVVMMLGRVAMRRPPTLYPRPSNSVDFES